MFTFGYIAAPYIRANYAPITLSEDSADSHSITFPEGLFETAEDKAALLQMKEVVVHLYGNYYRKLKGKDIAKLMIEGGLTSVDPHSVLHTPVEARAVEEGARGVFGGLGMEITKSDDTKGPRGVLVVSPIDDTPAAIAGIKAKDIIIKMWPKGKPIQGQPAGEGIATAGMDLEEAKNLLRGEVNTPIDIEVYREGVQEPISFRLVRDVIQVQFVKYELKEGVATVRISSFGEPVAQQTRDAILRMRQEYGKPLEGVFINLSNNPGGLLGAADELNDQFLTTRSPKYRGGVLATISQESRGNIQMIAQIGNGEDVAEGAPVVVQVNGGSASASEIVAKTLKKYGRATIVGIEDSFGKGTIQALLPLSDGSAFRETTGQYLIGPAGCEEPVQGKGVSPDIYLKPKEGERTATTHEKDLPNSIGTSTVSNADCKHQFEVSAEHKAAAYKILKVMGLEPKDPAPTATP
jgi:carboxyl-terminal processing protease